MKNKPIKRHETLKPISREHHIGLLASWKIREGFRKNIELNRIKAFTDWLWENHLVPHFKFEEEFMFKILPTDHEFVKKALAEHRRLERLFNQDDELFKSLSLIEEELEKHIRFEERILFNEIQEHATSEQLEVIAQQHDINTAGEWEDEFWNAS